MSDLDLFRPLEKLCSLCRIVLFRIYLQCILFWLYFHTLKYFTFFIYFLSFSFFPCLREVIVALSIISQNIFVLLILIIMYNEVKEAGHTIVCKVGVCFVFSAHETPVCTGRSPVPSECGQQIRSHPRTSCNRLQIYLRQLSMLHIYVMRQMQISEENTKFYVLFSTTGLLM